MRYHYIAFQPDGKTVEGDLDVKEPVEVLKFLAKQGLRPITVKPAGLAAGVGARRFFGQKINITDKVFLTRYLALMLKVGTDLFRAIDILIADFDKPVVKALLLEIRGSLEKGQPLHTTFARYPKFFSEVFINLIKAGESSGNLEGVFGELSASLEKESELRGRIRGALIYPILLLVMAVVIMTFLVTFALPKIAEVFSGGGIEPPLFSRLVFGVGLFLGNYIWWILGSGAILLFALWYFFAKTLAGRRFLGRLINFLPIIKPLVKKLALQRFASTMAALLRSGLPILDSLEITANTVGQEELAVSLRRIAREGIAKGMTVGEAFKREAALPKVVVNLIAISEKAGHLEEVLKTLGDFYDLEIDRALKTFVSILEPALMAFLGLVVGFIALAIIVPIYQLVGQF